MILSLKSFDSAVNPDTPTSAPGILSTVAGTMSSRSTASDVLDALSEPEPSTGTAMLATVPALLMSTVMGPFS